jgi:uncharacterized protein YjiS (DUF1127 family)
MIMGTISSAPGAAQGMAELSATSRLLATLKRWWVAYMTWRIQRAAITSLGDRQLKDIRFTRSGPLAR